jgi:GAF domain-containing protein
MTASILTREQLEERLAALHRASLQLIQETSLEELLRRIATVACEQVSARYGAVGVLNDQGELEQFITIGMTEEEVARMPHPPLGRGLIGALMHNSRGMRIKNISSDPRSVGFPKFHPDMTSLLGVPIQNTERQLGQIYLTNKLNAEEFTEEDQQVIETLAAYAAIAISNARLYRKLTQREKDLTRRSANLALLNDLASALAASPDIDQTLDIALTQVMEYLHLQLGQIFLREEESKVLKLTLFRGNGAENMWRQKDRSERGTQKSYHVR